MDAPEISVYGEAKGEYTRQLCVFLVPSLETYFLNLLEEAKKQSPSAQKNLWEFQNLLQSIPDWNQDKVIRETELIQKDCKCDYIEELLTAVFIAHTKVLSAIRLTTKQKKLQITIPKIDHFLHRVLSDCARSLWTNAYLFANTNSIEKQKNLRQVSSLIQEAILQSIRGLLPVKSILREYLHADADEGDDDEEAVAEVKPAEEAAEEAKPVAEEAKPVAEEAKPAVEEAKPVVEEANPAAEEAKPVTEETKPAAEETKPAAEEAKPVVEEAKPVVEEAKPAAEEAKPAAEEAKPAAEGTQAPMIYIDTKPSVTFAQEHVVFDSNTLEDNEIHDLPFTEAENKEENEDDEDEQEENNTQFESLNITDEILQLDADEIIN
jgi:hypothetical protein